MSLVSSLTGQQLSNLSAVLDALAKMANEWYTFLQSPERYQQVIQPDWLKSSIPKDPFFSAYFSNVGYSPEYLLASRMRNSTIDSRPVMMPDTVALITGDNNDTPYYTFNTYVQPSSLIGYLTISAATARSQIVGQQGGIFTFLTDDSIYVLLRNSEGLKGNITVNVPPAIRYLTMTCGTIDQVTVIDDVALTGDSGKPSPIGVRVVTSSNMDEARYKTNIGCKVMFSFGPSFQITFGSAEAGTVYAIRFKGKFMVDPAYREQFRAMSAFPEIMTSNVDQVWHYGLQDYVGSVLGNQSLQNKLSTVSNALITIIEHLMDSRHAGWSSKFIVPSSAFNVSMFIMAILNAKMPGTIIQSFDYAEVVQTYLILLSISMLTLRHNSCSM